MRRTIRDASRAWEVLKRLRTMVSNNTPTMELVDINGTAREVIALSTGELQLKRTLLQTAFAGV